MSKCQSNGVNGETMADKLGLGPEVHELKLGSSFNTPGTGFHTLRYDFKPASMDARRSAMLDVGTTNEVMVSVPHGDGGGQSVFKGPRKPYPKECVLVFDRRTGEIVLERLSNNINVKKTRMEKLDRLDRLESSSARLAPPRPVTPVDGPGAGRRPSPSVPRHSPLQTSPGRSPSSTSGQKPSPSHLTRSPGPSPNPSALPLGPGSLPIIGHDDPDPSSQQEGMPGILTDSSSSDSSSESSSSDSDSESERVTTKKKTKGAVAVVPPPQAPPPTPPSLPSLPSLPTLPSLPSLPPGPTTNHNSHLNGVNTMSMSSHFLNEDLQLSESESDSD